MTVGQHLRSANVIKVVGEVRQRSYAAFIMLATSPNSQKTSRQRERRWNPPTVISTCVVCSRTFVSKVEADQHLNSAHRGEIYKIFQRALASSEAH